MTQSTFLDAPWDPIVRDQVLALNEHLAEENKKLEVHLPPFFLSSLQWNTKTQLHPSILHRNK